VTWEVLNGFFVGSTSKYIVEHAECNVVVVKKPVGPSEMHDNKASVIAAEEIERLQQIDAEVPNPEQNKAMRDSVVAREEAERARRIENGKDEKEAARKLFDVFMLKEQTA